jgi:hypothetical protein
MTSLSLRPDPFIDDFDEPGGQVPLPCADKLAFDTQRLAAVAANVAQYQHGALLRPYRCRYCDLWHLASV